MQLAFFDEEKFRLELKDQKGKRKSSRPLLKSKPIHLILKARYVLHSHEDFIKEKIALYAKKFGIRIFDYAISNDHIHFAIQIPNREYYKKFIRSLTGIIARAMGKGTWRLIPLTKIVMSRFHFRNLLAYIRRNYEEVHMLRAYKTRKYSKKDRQRLGTGGPATLSPRVTNALY